MHVLALGATFGTAAHMLHFLLNHHFLSRHEAADTATLFASIGLCMLASSALSTLVLASAIASWRDANKRVHLEWRSDNTVTLTPVATTGHSNELASLVYLPVKGGYNNHFCLVLALSDVSQNQPAVRTKRLVLARDAMSDEAFRLLRVWMQLDSYRRDGSNKAG